MNPLYLLGELNLSISVFSHFSETVKILASSPSYLFNSPIKFRPRESNLWPPVLQLSALPTELSPKNLATSCSMECTEEPPSLKNINYKHTPSMEVLLYWRYFSRFAQRIINWSITN